MARGVTPFLPLCGRSSALGEGYSMCRWRRSRRWQECRRGSPGERAWRGQELRLPRSAEGECAPKNRSTAKYLGGGRGQGFTHADRSPHGGVKRSTDRLPIGLRAARFPPRKSAGTSRRPSRHASFSETRGADRYSRSSGEKSRARTNSQNLRVKKKNKKE